MHSSERLGRNHIHAEHSALSPSLRVLWPTDPMAGAIMQRHYLTFSFRISLYPRMPYRQWLQIKCISWCFLQQNPFDNSSSSSSSNCRSSSSSGSNASSALDTDLAKLFEWHLIVDISSSEEDVVYTRERVYILHLTVTGRCLIGVYANSPIETSLVCLLRLSYVQTGKRGSWSNLKECTMQNNNPDGYKPKRGTR